MRTQIVTILASLVFSSLSFADTAAPSCDWLVGQWKCVEASTKFERNLIVQSFSAEDWRMALYDEDVPDDNSEEWSNHKITNKDEAINELVKERGTCNTDGDLVITRRLSFVARATTSYKKAGEGLLFSHSVTSLGEAGFTETLSCTKVLGN